MTHHSVLLPEVLHWLDLPNRRCVIDATLGLGGHSRGIFSHSEFHGTIIGIDQDQRHLDEARSRLQTYSDRFMPVKMNFGDLERFTNEHVIRFDGILFDLGVASPHYDVAERGFSFQQDGPLDMRMDADRELTAEQVVNTYPEEKLYTIFQEFGEERLARRISSEIGRVREVQPIRSTQTLAELIKKVYHRAGLRSSHKHPATKVFQALRIAVNAELDVFQRAIATAIEKIEPGGRILVISYHSLEDRIVKKAFQKAENPCTCPPQLAICACGKKPLLRILQRKAIVPTEAEIRDNPRARSAKMRVGERIS